MATLHLFRNLQIPLFTVHLPPSSKNGILNCTNGASIFSFSHLWNQVCLINPIWGNPLPQSDSNFGNFGEEARGTDDELAEDPLGDIFGDILNGFGNLVQEGMKLITNVTESDVISNFFFL